MCCLFYLEGAEVVPTCSTKEDGVEAEAVGRVQAGLGGGAAVAMSRSVNGLDGAGRGDPTHAVVIGSEK